MANEITVSCQLSVNNQTTAPGAPVVASSKVSFQKTQAAPNIHPDQWVVTNAAGGVAMPIGSVVAANQGYVQLSNAHATAVVEIGLLVSAVFQKFSTLQPGDVAEFPVSPSVTLYGKSSIASSNVNMLLAER